MTHAQVAVKIKHDTNFTHCYSHYPAEQPPWRQTARYANHDGGLTLDPGCRVSVTRSESPPPAAALRSSTTAEVTGSHRRSLCRREVEASEGLLFHETETETARGEEKGPCGRAAAEATAAATVDSSMVWLPLRGGDSTGE